MNEDLERALEAAIDLQARGDLAGAAHAFERLGAKATDDHRFSEEAGNLFLYQLGDGASAIRAYRRALELAHDASLKAELWHRIGFAYTKVNDDVQASVAFGEAHEHDPIHAGTFLEVGRLCMRTGRFQDALEYLDTAWAQHVMQSALSGGPVPHFRALVTMDKARVYLKHLGDLEAGLAVAGALREMGDRGRLETLARELEQLGRTDAAARVKALLD
jgi:tetratricopeptide (TPR) repeat protein